MTRQILVPVDGSDPAWEALSFAFEHHPEADITAYYVVDLASLPDESVLESAVDNKEELDVARREHAQQILANSERVAEEYGADIDTQQGEGYTVEEILDYTEDHGIDQIIMGSHGRTGLNRVLVGSVAEKVTRRATVPVTIVSPEPAEG
jgi:nucleotide-binding universal stress UspA family protein